MDREKNSERISLEIFLYGIVQGVGFRPFVKRQADKHGLTGLVINCNGFVKIVVTGDEIAADLFSSEIISSPPKKASILKYSIKKIGLQDYEKFTIKESEKTENNIIFPAPDLPVCDYCITEILDKFNRRADYPLNSCTNCGPRYSIMEGNPYDRNTTVMKDFSLCQKCESEYNKISNRRFHAQTISCHDCGPIMKFVDEKNQQYTKNSAIEMATSKLNQGGIIAIKGIGGYHLACSPFNSEAILRLRTIKNRDAKPFAVMFLNVEEIKEHCEVSTAEEKLLKSDIRPIVLLSRNNNYINESVYNSSRFLGCFIAYTPLHFLLIEKCGPLVMTSANISDEPIIFEDEKMLEFSRNCLDGVLYHDRRICTSLDDSVARVIGTKAQFLRRGRGITPLAINFSGNDKAIFATGGQLKSCFCLSKGEFVFQSQYFGDLDNINTLSIYTENYYRLKSLLEIQPEIVACDMHPFYETTAIAKETGLPFVMVQHHVAHIASVMAEHNLERVIGVAFDGTGFGDDGQIWGGEFFLANEKVFSRMAHINYVDIPSSDLAMKNARISAGCFKLHSGLHPQNQTEEILKKAIDNSVNTIKTSSIGRLFDAVSSILGICCTNSYEGECAILLENSANVAILNDIEPLKLDFDIIIEDNIIINTKKLITAIISAVENGEKTESIALGFHDAVAEMIVRVCSVLSRQLGEKTVALSGGVFQNKILLEKAIYELEKSGFEVFINQLVPTNDSGIAVGQAYVASKGLNLI